MEQKNLLYRIFVDLVSIATCSIVLHASANTRSECTENRRVYISVPFRYQSHKNTHKITNEF